MSETALLNEWLPWLLTAVLAAALLLVLMLQRGGRSGHADRERLAARLEELNRISSRIDDLHAMFTLPHVRGGVGETLLEELLRNWLPEQAYSLQHSFSNGSRADAVVRMGRYLVAIDAKFPLQSVQQALGESRDENQQSSRDAGGEPSQSLPASVRRTFRGHARDIAEKYIRPEEGTLQFAIMYIPSERLYYRCFVEDARLAEEVLSHHVVPTGPSALFIYLQTVAYGLRGFAMPDQARELNAALHELRKENEALAGDLSTAAGHLKNLTGAMDAVDRRERKLERILDRLAGRG
jgi:DNA recombination protein RmuC